MALALAGAGAPSRASTRAMEVAVVADHGFIQYYGSDSEAQLCRLMAAAGLLYQQSPGLQIRLVHTQSFAFDVGDPYQFPPTDGGSADLDWLLAAFGGWAPGPGAR